MKCSNVTAFREFDFALKLLPRIWMRTTIFNVKIGSAEIGHVQSVFVAGVVRIRMRWCINYFGADCSSLGITWRFPPQVGVTHLCVLFFIASFPYCNRS